MKRYSRIDEETVRAHGLVREWTRSGLLDEAQGARLAEELRPDLKRTNHFLRAVLFLFTGIIVGASVLLVADLLEIRDPETTAAICVVAALLCLGLAELLTGRFRLYRFGADEALVVAGVLLVVIAAVEWLARGGNFKLMAVASLLIGAAGGLAAYCRYGFVYAGIAAIACAATIPFQLDESAVVQRLLASAILIVVFVLMRVRHLRHGDDFPGDDYSIFQSAGWAGLYVVLNLQITDAPIPGGWFYWTTYALTWLLPIIGLSMSLRVRDRLMMDLSAAMALTTLTTNKLYLGLQPQAWDPILFGLFLMGTAIVIRRWLSSGTNGERSGFTPARILQKDSRLMTVVSTASAAFQPQTQTPQSVPTANKPDFQGGRSGGAGASGEF